MNFKNWFSTSAIDHWSDRYKSPGEERIIELGQRVKRKGFLTKDEFLKICEWKTKRSKSRCARNKEEDVQQITRLALLTKTDDIKIKLLCTLHGVEWATASTILHFCDKEPYPIFDYRALWSLGINKPNVFSGIFWVAYKNYIKELAALTGKSFRVIDRALWQYSKENQGGT